MNRVKLVTTVLLVGVLFGCAKSQDKNVELEEITSEEMSTMNLDTATFGAGCFWCVEAVFQDLKGVAKVESGYAGGFTANPTYKEVCSGATGHAEVARIWFDPTVISYETLLEVLWHAHNPTTLNRQGNDVGTQYRSVVFYHSEDQRIQAEASKAATDSSGLWPDPIVTEIQPVPEYYPAENYHQNYLKNNPNQAYCAAVVAPKVQKIRKEFKHLLKSSN